MIRPDTFDTIRGSILLRGMNNTELARLASVCEERQLAAGTTIFIENMPGESLFLIRRGAVRISRMFAEGNEKVLIVLGPADVFGEMAVIDGLPRAATARVVDDAELISLRKQDFARLCQEHPALALKLVLNIVTVFSRQVREANEEYREMLTWSQPGERT
jgi:CRP/FNR family transcriptional regulator, cyclic AMP receptor protein